MLGHQLEKTLKSDPLQQRLVAHPFYGRVATEALTRGQVGTFLGQWWHPLHYFPVFLSRLIAVSPRPEVKTAISKILFQELGEGDARRAHEVIYVRTMTPLGFDAAQLSGAAPLPATARLIAGYAEASGDFLSGLGFLYGTEVADLAMVSALGTAVRRATGAQSLEWVDIHVEQEPEHVARANDTVACDFSEAQERAVLAGAQSMWRHWIGFFDELDRSVFGAPVSSAAS